MNIRERLKDLFIPNVDNGYKPNFLERTSFGIMLVLILLSFSMANLQALLWMGSEWMVSTILPAVIVDLTNEERGNERLGTLRRSEVLDRAAQMKAQDMAKNQYFSHYSPAGISPWYWFDQVSYDFVSAGENLAVHFTDSQDVVTAWMNSPGHRANILSGNYTEIGVGTAQGEYKGVPTVFVVQLFGRPAAPRTVPESIALVNETVSAPQEVTTTPVIPEEKVVASETVTPIPVKPVIEVPPPIDTPPETEPVEFVPPTDEPYLVIDPPEPIQEEEQQFNESESLYSDLATTSRDGIPATIRGEDGGGPQTTPLERGATQPNRVLQFIYAILTTIVFGALLLSIVIEWRRQHPVQIAYAGGLLAAMVLLLYVHTSLTSGAVVL